MPQGYCFKATTKEGVRISISASNRITAHKICIDAGGDPETLMPIGSFWYVEKERGSMMFHGKRPIGPRRSARNKKQ